MRDLLTRAASYGLTVHGAHLRGEKIGKYVPSLGRIYFDLSLTSAERRSVVAHELGHAHYGHDCDSPANERLADAYAATLLVNPEWYAELELINTDAEWIADEMQVAPWTIVDYRTYCLQRIGSVTYARARMGAGQWVHRAVSV
ncbi:ImmA/IrrE family metallo-endopeptidase [Microbacterium sp.]|uniref:ImmA/IrrE family metallo-endopeptidase n=1 Tax=Microbacterium sp. TaxID=51671 RepID=UPI003241BFEC